MEYSPGAVPMFLHRVGNEAANVEGSTPVITIPAGSYLAIPMSAPFYGTLPGGVLPPPSENGYLSKGASTSENMAGVSRKVFVVDPQDSYPLRIESVWSLREDNKNNSEETRSVTEAHTRKAGLNDPEDVLETTPDIVYCGEKSPKQDTISRSQPVGVISNLQLTSSAEVSSTAQATLSQDEQTQTSLPSSAFQPASCTQDLSFMCCRRDFSSEELFFAHLKEVHSEGFVGEFALDSESSTQQSFTCDDCGQVFSEERLHSLHCQIVKIANSPVTNLLDIVYKGQDIGTKAATDTPSSEKKVQPPKGSFNCCYCKGNKPRTFFLYSAFSRHMDNMHNVPPQNEHGRPQCQVCVEEFPDTNALYKHVESCHVRKATNVFNECVENVRSRTASGLEMKCVFCQRLFTKERLYFAHVKGHFTKKAVTTSKKQCQKFAEVEVAEKSDNLPTEMDSCKDGEENNSEEGFVEVEDESGDEEAIRHQEMCKKKTKKLKEKKKQLKRRRASSASEPKAKCLAGEEKMEEKMKKKKKKMKRKRESTNEEDSFVGRYSFIKSLIKASNEEDDEKAKTSDKVIKSKTGRLIKRKYPGSEGVGAKSESADVARKTKREQEDQTSVVDIPCRGRPKKHTVEGHTSKQQSARRKAESQAVNSEAIPKTNDMHTPEEDQAQKRKQGKHEKTLGFYCCGKSYAGEAVFFLHLHTSHQQFHFTSKSVSNPCSDCGLNFPSVGQLSLHTTIHEALAIVGMPDKLHQSAKQPSQSATKSEANSPESAKPVGYFVCQLCKSQNRKKFTAQNKTYNTFWAFSFHMQRAHNVPFLNEKGKPQCQYCLESFTTEGECYKHISTSHPRFIRAPTSTFSQQVEDCLGQDGDNKCVLCGREFLKRRVCQIHLKKHFTWE